MKRSNWVRLVAVILIISMLAAPVSAAPFRGNDGVRTNGVVGIIVDFIRDIIRDIFDDWFDEPGEEEPTPTTPVNPTTPTPTQPGETEPEETDPTEPGETKPTQPGETQPTQPGETQPGETEPTEPGETEPKEDEDKPETTMQLIEGYENTENGHLLRGHTYTLSQVIAQQNSKPATTTTANRFGTKLGNGLGGNSIGTGLKPMGTKVTTLAEGGTPPLATHTTGLKNGNYLLVNANQLFRTGGGNRAVQTTPNPNNQLTSTSVDLNNIGTDVIWTMEVISTDDNGNITAKIKTPSGQCLTYADNKVTLAADATVTIVPGTSTQFGSDLTKTWGIWFGGTTYLNYQNPMGTWSFDEGSHWCFYEITVSQSADDSSRDIPVEHLTATADNSEADRGEGPEKVLDNNNGTVWHTDWDGSARDTHWILFELSGEYEVDGLRYLPRQSTDSDNGIVTEYEIQVSDDGQTFTPVTTGTWTQNRDWKIATFDAVNTKYVRLVVKNAMSDNSKLFASAAEIRLTGIEVEQPEEPENPEPLAELIYFPVTMFNYNNGTTLLNDDSILRNLTHQAEVKAGLKEMWEGLYFSGGTPSSTSYTYSATVDAHTDLTWQQVMNGTYYADEACTNQAVVNEIIEGSGEYASTNVTVGEIWAAFGGDANDTWYPTTYKHRYYGEYYTVAIRRTTGASYYTLGYQAVASRPDLFYHLGDYNASDVVPLYAVTGSVTGYNLVAGGQTLATLNGTNTNEQIGVTLYTAGGTQTVNKFYAKWNWWSYRTNSEDAVDDQNKFFTGLVQDELVDGEIKFNVVEPGIFTFDSSDPTVTNDGIKDIYQNVGLPFVKNVTREGFYTFDSDAHGTYFKDTNGDGKSDPSYGISSTDYFEMLFDYETPQGWPGMWYGDGSSKLWAPYNTNSNDSSEGNIDYHFGMRADIPFSMTPNGCVKSTDDNSDHIEFSFAGDDDVWIFIDGHLVIDLGGIHNRIGATIDFADNTITYKRPTSNINTLPIGSFNNPEKYPLNEDGTITVKLYNDTEGEGALGQTRTDFAAEEEHVMTIFYLERGKGTSNCKIEFNLPMRDTLLITKDATMSWSEKQDAGDGDKDGTAPMTTKEQAAVDKLNFGFTLFKKNHDETAFTAVKNTNFFVQDKDGKVIATSSTDGNGKFYLKNGQTAKFMTDFPKEGVTYYVVEDAVPEGFLTPDYQYAGVAIDGFEYIGSRMDENGNNFEMDEAIKVSNASLIPEHELPLNANENKSYEITAYGSIEAIDSLEFKCINYLNADLPNPTALAYEDMIVIDYGLPVQVDPLANDLFRGEDIEIVAWGDENLELHEALDQHGNAIPYGTEGGTYWTGASTKAVAHVGKADGYNTDAIELDSCLYTFNAIEDGLFEVSAITADGEKVYLNHYSSNSNNIPNITTTPGRITVSEGSDGRFKLWAKVITNTGSGNDRTLHFHAESNVPYWNRCANDATYKCQEYLFRKANAGETSSTEIPGYVRLTQVSEVKDGGQYLIAAKNDAGNWFVLNPSTSNVKEAHAAKIEVLTNNNCDTATFDFGTVTFIDKDYPETADVVTINDRDSFEYRLTKQLTEVEVIHYIIKVTSTVEETAGEETIIKTACRYSLAKIYIAPATIMYYEENFSDMITFEGAGWDEDFTVSNQNNVSPFQEPGVVGTVGDSTYGSDVAYLSDNGDSNGTHRFGDTSNKAIRFTYTFTGTGTSIFARTSAETGYMQVKIYAIGEDGQETLQSTTYRDTYWKDENKTDLDASGTLYNIPVFTEEFQHYGTYKVVCTVAKAGTTTAGNDNGSGNEFYLDGIRVMQPLNEDSDQDLVERAQDAYAADGESNLEVVTLRQKLITDYEIPFDPESGEKEENWPFAVLTDINGEIVLASDYISIGPKEEVYLSKDPNASNGQKVSFSLKYWEPDGLKLYMGMKAPFGNAKVHVGHDTYELKNAPDCYYDVTNNYESLLTETEQATDAEGNLLFLDDNDNFIVKIDSNDGTATYYYDDYETVFDDVEQLRPLMMEYYVVTYTFEAAESIVSLTNIKVVGQYEFSIVEDTNINVEGPEGGNDVEPNEP